MPYSPNKATGVADGDALLNASYAAWSFGDITAFSCSKHGCIRLLNWLTCSSGNHAAGLVHSLALPLI